MSSRTAASSRELAVVVTCEHAGNAVPARWAGLFRGARPLLESHRGHDPGALHCARALARSARAPLLFATTSRLLVDLNRSLGHPRLYSDRTRVLPASERALIVDRHWRPHRAAVERAVATAIGRGARVLHIAAHTFTPVFDGAVRRADVGLLFDPARPLEAAIARTWQEELRRALPKLRVRRNYPYRGVADGLTTALRRRHGARDYAGIELEVNQRIAAHAGSDRTLLVRALAATLTAAAARAARPA